MFPPVDIFHIQEIGFGLLQYLVTLVVYTEPAEVLKTWDSYRKVDWVNEIEYPELTYQETQKFLSKRFENLTTHLPFVNQ